MKQVHTYCNELLNIIDNSKTGHLPLSYRVNLMRLIKKPTLINKILFECAKKVYPVLQNDYPDDTIFAEILHKCDEHLYHNKHNKKDFSSLGDKYKNYAESGEDNSNYAAISIVYLCYSIAGDAGDMLRNEPDFEYEGEDDNEFDADQWTTDFYASLAYSAGSPFTGDGDIQKRKEFWIWFIHTTIELINFSNKPILLLPTVIVTDEIVSNNLYNRTQTYKVPLIEEKIDAIIEKTLELVNEKSIIWRKITLKSFNFHSGNLYDVFYLDENAIEQEFKRIDRDNIQLFAEIKDEMYVQKPEEGSWLQSYLTIFPKGEYEYEYEFNYDNKDALVYFADDFDKLRSEFEAYPRKKEFTPDWWQKILGRRAKYLK
jgi:hypothetical protein